MIDLHSHVLPGIDDGPATIEESVRLARACAAEGTRTLAATPHLRHDHPAVRAEELAAHCRMLEERLGPGDASPGIVSGAELDYEWAQSASPEELTLASYGQRGTDVLLETPYAPITVAFEGVVFRLASLGFRVLLAHPERNPTFQRDGERLRALVRRGALVQLTAGSLLERGRRRAPSTRLARVLVESGLAHVIASDAHSAGSGRRPNLSRGVAAVEQIAPGVGEWMATEAAAAVLAGERLPRRPPGRRRWSLRSIRPKTP